ncbi:unnamed protein product, partial [Scytosiphon promiscuus]
MGTWLSPPLDVEAFRPPPDGFPTPAAAAAALAATASPDFSTTKAAAPSAAATSVSAAPAVTNFARAEEDVGDTPPNAGGGQGSSSDRPPPTVALPLAKPPAPVECTAKGKRSRAAFEAGGSGIDGDRVAQENNSLGNRAALQKQGGGGAFGGSAHESAEVAELVADVLAAGPEAAARQEATGIDGQGLTVGVDAFSRSPHLCDGVRSSSAPLAAPGAPTYETFSETSVLAEGGGATTLEPRTELVAGASPWPTVVRTTIAAAGLWDALVHSPAAAPAPAAAFSAPGVGPPLAFTPNAADGGGSRPTFLPLPAATLAVSAAPRLSPLAVSASGSTSSVILSNGSVGGSGGDGANPSPPSPSGAPPQVVGAAQGGSAREGHHSSSSADVAAPIAPPPPPPPPASSLPMFFFSRLGAEGVVDDRGKPPHVDTDFLRQMSWISAPISSLGPSITPDGSHVATAGEAPRLQASAAAAAAATASVAALLEQHLHQHHHNPSTPLLPPPVESGDIDVGLERQRADTSTPPVPAAGPPSGDGGGGTTNRTTPGDSRRERAHAHGEPPSRAPQPPPLLRPDDVVPHPSPRLQQPAASTPVDAGDGRGGGGGGAAHRQRRRTCGEEG